MNYQLAKCNGEKINLLDLLQENDKQNLILFFNQQSSWAQGVLDAINNKTSILELLTPDTDVYIDVGAHVGLSCLFAEPYCKKIYSIEPTPNHYYILEKLTQNNPKFIHYFGAIGIKTGQQPFYQDMVNNTQNSLIIHDYSQQLGIINTITLEDFIEQSMIDKVDLLKLDIEGYETPLILDKTFDKVVSKISKIYIEVHNIEHGEYKNLPDINRELINNKLQKLGFKTKIVEDAILGWNQN